MPSKPNGSIYLHKNSLLDAERVAVYGHVVSILISCHTLKISAQSTNFSNSPRRYLCKLYSFYLFVFFFYFIFFFSFDKTILIEIIWYFQKHYFYIFVKANIFTL